MCYGVYISTDSTRDLTSYNTDLLRFEKVVDPKSDPCIALLEHGSQWYVGSKSGCSCTFRHLKSIELGFSEPVDWYEEGQEELDATLELYAALDSLLTSGHQVDLVDRWEGSRPCDIKTLDVSLGDESARVFRLFENHKFRLRKERTQPSLRRRETRAADFRVIQSRGSEQC